MLLKPCQRHRRQHAARRAAVDADILGAVRGKQRAIGGGDVLACGRVLVLRTLTIIEAHDLDAPERSDRQRLELGASRPALAKPAAVQIDEHAVAIVRCDTALRRVHVGMHAADRRVLAVDGEELALAREVPREQRRHTVFLDEHLGPLQIDEVLGEVGLSCSTQEARRGHGLGRHVHGAVRLDDDLRWRRWLRGCRDARRESHENEDERGGMRRRHDCDSPNDRGTAGGHAMTAMLIRRNLAAAAIVCNRAWRHYDSLLRFIESLGG